MFASTALGMRRLVPKVVSTTVAQVRPSATSVRLTVEFARPQPNGFVV